MGLLHRYLSVHGQFRNYIHVYTPISSLNHIGCNFLFDIISGTAGDLPCTDAEGKQVENGEEFAPNAEDPCYTCKCENGFPVACVSVHCLPPDCELYDQLDDECCNFQCVEIPGGSPRPGNGSGVPILPGDGISKSDHLLTCLRL